MNYTVRHNGNLITGSEAIQLMGIKPELLPKSSYSATRLLATTKKPEILAAMKKYHITAQAGTTIASVSKPEAKKGSEANDRKNPSVEAIASQLRTLIQENPELVDKLGLTPTELAEIKPEIKEEEVVEEPEPVTNASDILVRFAEVTTELIQFVRHLQTQVVILSVEAGKYRDIMKAASK